MKTTKRIISLFMALIMSLSCVSASLVAQAAEIDAGDIKIDLGDIGIDTKTFFNDPETNIIQAYVTDNGNANEYNASAILDYLDQVLANIELGDTLDTLTAIGSRLGIKIDISSVDGLLQTLDTAKSNQRLLRLNGSLKLMNMDNWASGQSRGKTGDYKVLFNLIQVLCDNAELIKALLNGTFTLGLIIDRMIGANPPKVSYIKVIIGDDPYAFIIGKIAELLGVRRDTLDNMIFNDFLPGKIEDIMESLDKKLDEALADSSVYKLLKQSGFKLSGIADGFNYDSSMYTDEFFASLFSLLWKNGIEGALKTLYSEHADELLAEIKSVPFLAPFADLMNFDGADTSLELSEMMDTNDAMGSILAGSTGVIRSYDGWKYGRKENLYGDNLQKLLMYMVDNRTKTADDVYAGYTFEKGNFMSYAMGMAKAIAKYYGYTKLENCDSLTDFIVDVLPQEINGKTISLTSGDTEYKQTIVIGEKSNTYEKVLGDIVGSLVDGHLPLYTDAGNTKEYVPGSGKTIWEVLNYMLNYYLVDLNLCELVGIDVTKRENCFEKLEAIPELLFTGVCPHTNAEKFLKTDIVENIINLNLGAFISAFEKIMLKDTSGDTMASLLYQIVGNVLEGTVGTEVLKGSFVSLDAIVQNESLGELAANFLKGLKSRHEMLPVFDYVLAVMLSGNTFNVKTTSSSKISLCDKKVSGVYLYYGKYPLTYNKDYKFITKVVGGETKAYVSGMGNYGGRTEIPAGVKIVGHTPENKVVKATTSKDGSVSVVCSNCGTVIDTLNKINRIETVALSQTKYAYDANAEKPTVTVADSAGKALVKNTDYTVKYSGDTSEPGVHTATVTFKGNYSGRSTLKFTVRPDVVTGLKAGASSSGIKLKWNGTEGATGYRIYRYSGGEYIKVGDTSDNSYTVKNLGSLKKYTFCVKAMAKTEAGTAYSKSYSSKASATTLLSSPKVTLKTSATKIKATWDKVNGADGYEVYMKKDGGSYKKVATVKGTEYKASSLKSGTKYSFKIRSYMKEDGETVRSAYTTKSAYTKPASPSVKVTSSSSGKASVSYKKVTGAKGYEIYCSTSSSGSYKKLKTTAAASYTKSGLKSGKLYYFKVRAYLLTGGEKVYSSYSSTKKVRIK